MTFILSDSGPRYGVLRDTDGGCRFSIWYSPASSRSCTGRAGGSRASRLSALGACSATCRASVTIERRGRKERQYFLAAFAAFAFQRGVRLSRSPESTARGREIARHFGNGFGVEDEIVPVEQARDAGPVDLHLQVANAQRTKHHDSVAIHTVVGDVDPLHARRRHGVDIGDAAQSGASRPRGAWNERHAGGAGTENQRRSLED